MNITFTNLSEDGKIHRALFLGPSIWPAVAFSPFSQISEYVQYIRTTNIQADVLHSCVPGTVYSVQQSTE